jgi:hypothetical protein
MYVDSVKQHDVWDFCSGENVKVWILVSELLCSLVLLVVTDVSDELTSFVFW